MMDSETISQIIASCEETFSHLDELETDGKVEAINEIKKLLHSYSPFNNEPVDCVLWVPADKVNEYGGC